MNRNQHTTPETNGEARILRQTMVEAGQTAQLIAAGPVCAPSSRTKPSWRKLRSRPRMSWSPPSTPRQKRSAGSIPPAAEKRPAARPLASAPTRQQGQFLAFTREFMLRNEAGLAPSMRTFNAFLTSHPRSVNSMLIRLEQRAFIRRHPGQGPRHRTHHRPGLDSALGRPFKFALR